MASLVRLTAVTVRYGDQTVLEAANFVLESGERVCLIGRNGAGKSTTLRLVTGAIEPDDGKVERSPGLRASMLDQALAEESRETARDFVRTGMAVQIDRLTRFAALTDAARADRGLLREIEALEREIIAGGGWSVDAQVDAVMSELRLPAAKRMDELSGGWRRRVALARALVSNPELLLLDEPTNHLDISTIEWLEQRVRDYPGAVLFVTHDRSFVERIATRIVDIDRGQLRSWPGAYSEYLRQRAKANADEDLHNRLFDKKLAQEEAWVRQGVKAREHRNEGRVRALEALRAERAERVARPRVARIHVNESPEVAGRKIIEARGVTHGFGDRPLLEDFSLRIMRGDRIGIIGNNGVGKSTLLKLLLGEIAPDRGSVKLGTNLEIGYFDQLRRELDVDQSVAEFIGEGRDYITINGRRKHVIAYLTDFLFSVKRARTVIAALSGGERNRVILAKLFTRPANLLVLDEPTNDLDVETLEALEQRLAEYQGTLLVVSHDRHFLDAVVDSVLVFEDDGVVRKHAGGYSDWARRHRELAPGEDAAPTASTDRSARPARRTSPGKLSYHLQRELAALPERIAALEAELQTLQSEVTAPEFYQQPHALTRERLEVLADVERDLETQLARWVELEDEQARLAAQREPGTDA